MTKQRRSFRDREPTIPPPNITEYKPQSTLVVPEHEVPRARFPLVDIHGHPPALDNLETIESVVAEMDRLNIGVMVQARPSSGQRLRSQIEAVREAVRKRLQARIEAGSADAISQFATFHLKILAEPDYEKAYVWLSISAALGVEGAFQARIDVRDSLDDEKLVDLQSQARTIYESLNISFD